MLIDLNKKGKLERLTNYYISFRGDFYVYCQFIKDIQTIDNFTLDTKTNLAGMIRFCQRQFVDSMIIKLSKLTNATLIISNEKLHQTSKSKRKQLEEKILTLTYKLKKSDLKKIRDKIVAHLDNDFLNKKDEIVAVNENYKVSENEEYEKILDLTGELINDLWNIQCNTTIFYPKRSLNLANQLLPIMISGYKNFYFASKSIGKRTIVDTELENFRLFLETKAEKFNSYKK